MIFVMKFQAAAMGRANVPEEEREDFSLYVDEFQNFATDSFETILSEARKYRLNLILANQFMTQLTDKIREAIIGNVGTIISGRIGTTDAELMQKKFAPTFDAEDLTKLPNFETVASVMIHNVPSSPFSMSLVPPLGTPNAHLAEALKRLSAAKYGRPRRTVEAAIFQRLRAGDAAREQRKKALFEPSTPPAGKKPADIAALPPAVPAAANPQASFLDDWLAKRRSSSTATSGPTVPAPARPALSTVPPVAKPAQQPAVYRPPIAPVAAEPINRPLPVSPVTPVSVAPSTTLQVRPLKDVSAPDQMPIAPADEIYIDIRGTLHHGGDATTKTSDTP
jgi:hypothetical protein